MKEKLLEFSKLILAIGELVVGVLLLINPIGFTNGIIAVLGVLLFVMGIISMLHYFKESPEDAAMEQSLSRGLMAALSGLFCIFKGEWFITAFPMLTVLYGVLTLIIGMSKVQWTVDMVRMKVQKWFWMGISAAVTLVCSTVILCNPFGTMKVLWIFIGVSLIVEAVFDVLVLFFERE